MTYLRSSEILTLRIKETEAAGEVDAQGPQILDLGNKS